MKMVQFDSLQRVPHLRHAITTRDGGVSPGEYSSLNLAFHVGDDESCVRENRAILADALDYRRSTLVAAQQVHGSNCQIVTHEYSGRGAEDWESAIPNTDALIVAEHDIPALILVADCAPILIVDPAREVLAVVHAGWRGAAASIASKTLQTMQRKYGSQPADVRAGIGPCLCVECLEVGEEVAAQVGSTHILRRSGWEKPHLDLRAMIRDDLAASGVLTSNIEIMNHCPRCEVETFFSHRGQNGKAGRFGLVAWWER